MRKFVAAIAVTLALTATGSATPASAESPTVHIVGHVTTYSGVPIHGLTVRVTSNSTQGSLDKTVRTTLTGRYSVTVHSNSAYSVTFFDRDTDGDAIDDRRFAPKTEQVSVLSVDHKLNEQLHRVPTPDTVQIHGVVRNFGGSPISPVVVELRGTLTDGTRIVKKTTTMKDGWYVVTVPADETYSIDFHDGASMTRYQTVRGHIRVLDANLHLSKQLHRAPKH